LSPLPFRYTGDKAGEVNGVLPTLAGIFMQRLGPNLKGLYLHGSLAMGCFRPWSSDIDLLAVTFGPMDRESKLALVNDVMSVAEGGAEFRKFELSVVTADEALRAKHPIRYILHYSDSWHEAYKNGKADLVIKGGEDEDLAAHFMVTRTRGAVLVGASIEEAFGQVSREDYLKSVWYDVRGAAEYLQKVPEDAVLNLCRTLMYLETGVVGSKLEGGRWAIARPELERWKELIELALTWYGTDCEAVFIFPALCEFADHMLHMIQSGS
jgi:predicted nucleotidyltransferase